jgi:hypothetical protein
LFYPRELSLWKSFSSLERLGNILPALLIWSSWVWADRASEGARFTRLFIAIAFGAYLLQKLANQVDINAQFELNAALAIGVGLCVNEMPHTWMATRFGVARAHFIALALLAAWIAAFALPASVLLITSVDFRATVKAHAEVARAEIRRVAAMPGNVSCDLQIVCYRAGKPFLFDATYVDQAIATGRLTRPQMLELLGSKSILIISIDPRVNARYFPCIADPRKSCL